MVGLQGRGKWTAVRTRESGVGVREVRPKMVVARSADMEAMDMVLWRFLGGFRFCERKTDKGLSTADWLERKMIKNKTKPKKQKNKKKTKKIEEDVSGLLSLCLED